MAVNATAGTKTIRIERTEFQFDDKHASLIALRFGD